MNNHINYSPNGEVLLSCDKDYSGDVAIQDGCKGICQKAFVGCIHITSVHMPESIIRIGSHAFADCTDLKEIVIPPNVEYIGKQAFANCHRLERVIINGQLSAIESSTFMQCVSLREIIFKTNTIKELKDNCFESCYALKTIDLPSSIKKIGKAFTDCMWLTQISIDANPDISSQAFAGCGELTRVQINHVSQFSKHYSTPHRIKTASYTIPDHFLAGSNSFAGTATINKQMGVGIFENCTSVEGVYITGKVRRVTARSFSNCPKLKQLEICDGVSRIDDSAFAGSAIMGDVYLPDTVKVIGSNAFSGCRNMTSASIPSSATIHPSAFSNCAENFKFELRNVSSNNLI